MSEVTIKDIIQIKTLLYSNMIALEVISEEDEMVQEEFGKFEAVIQWKIGNFITGYIEIKDSKPKLFMNSVHNEPTVIITIIDIKSARELFNGKVDATKLFLKGKIIVEGDLKKGMKLFTASELLEEYIAIFKSMR